MRNILNQESFEEYNMLGNGYDWEQLYVHSLRNI